MELARAVLVVPRRLEHGDQRSLLQTNLVRPPRSRDFQCITWTCFGPGTWDWPPQGLANIHRTNFTLAPTNESVDRKFTEGGFSGDGSDDGDGNEQSQRMIDMKAKTQDSVVVSLD